MSRNDPLEQLRALSRRRASARSERDREARLAADASPGTAVRTDDTQPVPAYAAGVEPRRRGRGTLIGGVAAGAVAGVVLALSIPALADSGSSTPTPGSSSSTTPGSGTPSTPSTPDTTDGTAPAVPGDGDGATPPEGGPGPGPDGPSTCGPGEGPAERKKNFTLFLSGRED